MALNRNGSPEGSISKKIVTTKGDLITATANAIPSRLAAGSNGDTLVADSAAATGLRWQASQAGGKNYVINGGLDIWQRGTSFTNLTGLIYTADRWQGSLGTMTSGTLSISRQSAALNGFEYSLRFQRNSGATTTGNGYLTHSLESSTVIPLQNKPIVFSFYAKAGANYSPTSSALVFQINSGTGTNENINNGYTGSAAVISQTVTLTSSWQRFTYTGTVGSTATELGFYFQYTGSGTAGADDWFEVTGVQIELGSVATTFTRAGGTLQGERAACQRYFQVFGNESYAYQMFAICTAESATNAFGVISLPVTMRTQPSAAFKSASGFTLMGFGTLSNANMFFDTNQSGSQLICIGTLSATGMTTYDARYIRANNDATARIELSAEL
jgi:hypothetical protein